VKEDLWKALDPNHPRLSLANQCRLLGINRSSYYLEAASETACNLELMNLIDGEHTAHPFYGSRRMMAWLRTKGHTVNRKRVQRLMQVVGIEAIYPKKNLSKADSEHKKYPYLLRDLEAAFPDHVWSTDITYIRLVGGFAYCTAIIDWYSRYVIAWRISNSLDASFCLEVLEEALEKGKPEIFNTDQGVQYTSPAFTGILEKSDIKISMDGRGRALDNIFVERLWRTLKYEDIYLKDYGSVKEVRDGVKSYFQFYNNERPHQSLNYRYPKDVYFNKEELRPQSRILLLRG
jgi:putative transposase